MLLSHHPPCDYERTVQVCGVRLCTRCFGVFLGAAALFAVEAWVHSVRRSVSLLPLTALTLPAAIDFFSVELGWRRSCTVIRLTTGILLGVAVGATAVLVSRGQWLTGTGFLAWLALVQFLGAIALRRADRLEDYLARYEDAVRKSKHPA